MLWCFVSRLLHALLSLLPPGSVSFTTHKLYITKLGPSSIDPVGITNYFMSLFLTATAVEASYPSLTILTSFTTIFNTNTLTFSSTKKIFIPTILSPIMTVDADSITSFFTTVTFISTVSKFPSFIPISSASGFYGKRDEPNPRATSSVPSLKQYPTAVSYTGVFELISTKTSTRPQ